MKICIATILLLALTAVKGQSQCLQTAPKGSTICYNIQQTGQKVADNIASMDKLVQSTIYQSIEEGSKMLAAAITLLKKDIASVRVASAGTAPIESSTMDAITTSIETVAKAAVKSANKEMYAEMITALKQLVHDDAFVNSVAASLGLSPTTRRRRRTVSDDDASLGNSIDGVIDKSLPAINQTLRQADLKMVASFQQIFVVFTASIKQLVGGKILINVDQVKQNMEKMIYEAAKVLIDAKVEYARTLFTDAVRHLQKIAVLAADYKTDNTKLVKVLEPAKVLISEAINKALSQTNEAGLTKRVEMAIARLKQYYSEMKKTVSA